MTTITTYSSEETRNLGEKIAKVFMGKADKTERATIVSLEGDLGGGKTTFVQGLGRGLGLRDAILSPTFILFRRYDLSSQPFSDFYHFDCYRIESQSDQFGLREMGVGQIIKNPKNIVAIEWADKIKSTIEPDLFLKFSFVSENIREISIDGEKGLVKLIIT
jgi:tRNA threonylcarbamoyladenosine biosynthesis protein TsaE